MEKDFHFNTVYALARAAGFGPDNAKIAAYASQHTDDAKYHHTLEFENGGRFQQTLTAHQFLAAGAISKDTSYTIYVPFHFIPGNHGVDFYERMYTRPNSIIAQRVVNDFLQMPLKPYSLHLLGIILHLYADTWSHQNFMGVEREHMNDVKDLKVIDEEAGWFEKVCGDLKGRICEYAFPMLGHAQAGTLPDEPYREWEYYDYRDRHHTIFNHERAMDAAQNCCAVLTRFLKQYPQFAESASVPWQDFSGKVSMLFGEKGTVEERCERWQAAISGGGFNFSPTDEDKTLRYDDREWFRSAVEVIKDEQDSKKPDIYERKIGFEVSNWKCFHDAASYHIFHALHEVLPEYGIICG
ncbi:MAG: hypothetical protein NT072_10485 [Deltaproteobacteria bacterium]|nr:hypothetical protein [Deltaproteobacteria bacterium]